MGSIPPRMKIARLRSVRCRRRRETGRRGSPGDGPRRRPVRGWLDTDAHVRKSQMTAGSTQGAPRTPPGSLRLAGAAGITITGLSGCGSGALCDAQAGRDVAHPRARAVLGADVAGVGRPRGDQVPTRRSGVQHHQGRPRRACLRSGDQLTPKPANLTFEQAAVAALSGQTALQGLRDHGRVQPGQKVLITGASGGVGIFAVQLTKTFRAHITSVCNTMNEGPGPVHRRR